MHCSLASKLVEAFHISAHVGFFFSSYTMQPISPFRPILCPDQPNEAKGKQETIFGYLYYKFYFAVPLGHFSRSEGSE